MRFLHLRAEHQPFRRPDGSIQIGAIPGIASILPDPGGWRGHLLDLLDGTRTLPDVLAAMATDHPDVGPAEIGRLIGELTWAGHLRETRRQGPPVGTDPDTAQRHQRGAEYWDMVDRFGRSGWDIHLRLARASVTIVGVGGAGASAATVLAAEGVGRLTLIDPDHVELSNLHRQHLYTHADIRRPKVEAAADRLRERTPDLDVAVRIERVTLQPQLAALMADCDLLLLAADEPEGLRLRANRASLQTLCPWVDAGYHGPVITTALYDPDSDAPCWECLRHGEAATRGLPGLHGDDLHRALPRPAGHPTTAVTATLAGTYAAHAALTHLTDTPRWDTATVYRHSLIAAADRPLPPVTHPRNPDCPSCATQPVRTP
ncbi:ThiF family adenylyltransferase [Kitasatospora aureofaciens]|uniref:HesA/MoeB/ThiF family protein n=1 Tax=Kitasatospora aureofaciens TaxID=1894 RepID=UPI001C481DE2|nr:ThiF family adenylyltransferase [Kitasatospora aureofaciens]MBV6700286.1 ThiF family adenylyltransferase [Kitasatospora aureofaciens]